MTILVPIMLFGWVPLTIWLFFVTSPQRAVLVSLIGGFLLLPEFSYDTSGLPPFEKDTAIALGIIIGSLITGRHKFSGETMKAVDLPMMLWCFAVPIVTSLTNGLGIYNGISGVVDKIFQWGAFYWIGRIYFNNKQSVKQLSRAIIIGGIIYVPLVLYEVRMSPQLSNITYGFFAHDWLQHIRYGGWRPIVFMQHGLMVSLWMAASATIAYWLWRQKEFIHIMGIPIWIVTLFLFISTILCKSANGWIFLLIGVLSYSIFRHTKSMKFMMIPILIVPLYIAFRLSGILFADKIESIAELVFDDQRVASLSVRLLQEDLFGLRALERPLFGWGGYGRNWPIDPYTGVRLIRMVDALWIIYLSIYGLFGLLSFLLSIGLGTWKVVRYGEDSKLFKISINGSYNIHAYALSTVVIFFLLDILVNGMINPIYVVVAGALTSFSMHNTNYETGT